MKRAVSSGKRGRIRLELALAAILVLLLAGLLLDRLSAYQAETERVAAKQLISALRTALAVRTTQALARGDEAALLALAQQNPIDWLQERPANYLGEQFSTNKDVLPTGHWYFDRVQRTLVFLPTPHKSFSAGIQKIQIFKVKLVHMPDPADAEGRTAVATGLVLDQMLDPAPAMKNIAVTVPRP